MEFTYTYMNLRQIAEYVSGIRCHGAGRIKCLHTFKDVYIITKNETPAILICNDKIFLDTLRYVLQNEHKFPHIFTNLCRCCIIEFEHLSAIIDIEEFCKRYGEIM